MLGAALIFLFLAMPAHAQGVLDPPRSEAGDAYRAKARDEGIAVDATVLSKDAPVTLRPGTEPSVEPDGSSNTRAVGEAFEGASWFILAGFLVLLAVVAWRAWANGLFDRKAKRRKPKPEMVELADLGGADLANRSLADIARMDDAREALRLLLLMGLKAASDANGIALSRSLTARDVFARVPRGWPGRDMLDVLVRKAELVMFGGRPFHRDDLASLVRTVGPLVRRP